MLSQVFLILHRKQGGFLFLLALEVMLVAATVNEIWPRVTWEESLKE